MYKDGESMKCANPNCGGEWTPPHGKSLTTCPFCGEAVASEKKSAVLDNVADTLIYIKEQYGVDTLLCSKVYTYFADLTLGKLRDDTDLIKLLCEKGSLDCLKEVIGKSEKEHENAVKRALVKLPKYLQDSPVVADTLCHFAIALGWNVSNTKKLEPPQNIVSANVQQPNNSPSVVPLIGSIHKFGGYDWRVLAVQGRQALVISEKILESRPYHAQCGNITWANCSLRQYLNGEFLNRFSASDKSKIVPTSITTLNNPWYGTSGGASVTDNIFLLSLEEVCRYFGDSRSNLAKKGSAGSDYFIDDKNSQNRIAKFVQNDEANWWWLRSPGRDGYSAAFVYDDGYVFVNGDFVTYDIGVRPAFWLNLES
jgi:hypothetical protein